ncbi:104_t:CDS:2 [Cetraspora pellucida]|uniref:104_t:CDS:1 n=1 Tax=Cetraspora pellucida TaxID=1433469 RepID=A0A9N8ZQX4_9GLOM|nr:104_t:CDS:2 [Cetraspora pellucida]
MVQTGEFLASKISNIVDKIGSSKFIACITDNGIKVRSVDHVLKQANQIVQFFKRSYRANQLLCDNIKSMKLGGSSLEMYVKTRCASIFRTMSSIVRLKPVFDKILDENYDVISQQAIISLLNNDDDTFYTNCHRIAFIIQLIKEAIYNLEARTANLADCFLYSTYRTCLSSKKIESMAQIHSFYIFNLKNELHYYKKELSESELHDSALALTTYADMENNSIKPKQNKDVLKSAQLNNNKLAISLIVNFSHANFSRQSNAEELSYTTQSGNMEFNPVAIIKREFQFVNDDLL